VRGDHPYQGLRFSFATPYEHERMRRFDFFGPRLSCSVCLRLEFSRPSCYLVGILVRTNTPEFLVEIE